MESNILKENITEEYFKSHIYYIIHKPVGILSAKEEFSGTKTLYDICKEIGFPVEKIGLVGRLDKDTSGLVLMTNDGRLNRALTFPSEENLDQKVKTIKEKENIITITSDNLFNLTKDDLLKLENEMSKPFSFSRNNRVISTKSAKIDIKNYRQDLNLSKGRDNLGWCLDIKVTISEGKHHQVRRIAERQKLRVVSLKRIKMGGLSIDLIPNPLDCKWLSFDEIKNIYCEIGLFCDQKEVYGKYFI